MKSPGKYTAEDILAEVCGNDPILKKWAVKFFQYRSKHLDSNMSLMEYVFIMERDEKLGLLID